jgi:hypothetical protein
VRALRSMRVAPALTWVLRSMPAVPTWEREPLPATRAPIQELGAESPRCGSRQTQRPRSPSPRVPREMAWAALPVPGGELAAPQQNRPNPTTTQTGAGPKWRWEEAMSPSPRSAANCHRSPGDAQPATGQAPTPAEVSCWKTCPHRVATPAVPNPWIGGDRRDAGLRREIQASPRDAGLRRETPASPRDAGLRRETPASPQDAGLRRETPASPRDGGPLRAAPASPQPTGWQAV